MIKLGQQIKEAQAKRKQSLDAMDAMIAVIADEGRTFTPDETKAWNGHEAEADALEDTIGKLSRQEARNAATARPAGLETDTQTVDPYTGMPLEAAIDPYTGQQTRGAPAVIVRTPAPVKGAFLARYAHCLYKAGGNPMLAIQYAATDLRDKGLAAMIKAAQSPADSVTPSWAAALVQQEMMDFIEMLRPLSVYAGFPSGSSFSFDSTNSIRIPRQTTGTPGGFVAEGAAIPVATGAFDSIVLSPHKMGVITVATHEILQRSTPSLEVILRDSMLRDTGIVLDRQFLSTKLAAGAAPSGLFSTDNAPAALAGSNTGSAVDDAIADINSILNAHFAALSPLTNGVWVMHPMVRTKLMSLRNAVGAFFFRDEIRNGSLYSYPILTSTLMDVTGNSGGASAIDDLALVDAAMLSKANGMAPTINMSDTASVHMESAPASDIGGAASPVRSLWQTDSVGLRLTYEIDFKMRHKPSVQWVDAIHW